MKYFSARRFKFISFFVFMVLVGQSCNWCLFDNAPTQPPSYLQGDLNIPSVADDLAPSGSGMPNSGNFTFAASFFRANGKPWYNEDFRLNINWAELGPTEAAINLQQQGSNQKSVGRIFKVEETNAPRPADRVFFGYNFFAEQAPGANYRETFSGPIIRVNPETWTIEGPYTHNSDTGTFKATIRASK